MNFENVNTTSFKADGIEYKKVFLPIVIGDTHIKIVCLYDTYFVLMQPTPIADVKVNGLVYDNATALVEKLMPIIFRPKDNITQSVIADADGDTKIEVEKTDDEDSARIIVKGKEAMRILYDGTIEIYDTLIRYTTPNRVYTKDGWFRAEEDLLGAFFKDEANEFWVYARHMDEGVVGTDRRKFNHFFKVRSRTVPATGRPINPNEEKDDGYMFQLIYFPKNGEGDNWGLPDHMLVQMLTANTYMVIGSWGPSDYEAGEKLAVHGGAFVKDTIRVGKIKLTNPSENTSGAKTLVYNEATDMVEVAQNTSLTMLDLSTGSGRIDYRLINGRLILIGTFTPTEFSGTIGTLPAGFRPDRLRRLTMKSVNEGTAVIIVLSDGNVTFNGAVSGTTYFIDLEITLTL